MIAGHYCISPQNVTFFVLFVAERVLVVRNAADYDVQHCLTTCLNIYIYIYIHIYIFGSCCRTHYQSTRRRGLAHHCLVQHITFVVLMLQDT